MPDRIMTGPRPGAALQTIAMPAINTLWLLTFWPLQAAHENKHLRLHHAY